MAMEAEASSSSSRAEKRARPDDKFYTPVADVKNCLRVWSSVNLFGVITEIGRSKKSKGTDYVVTLKIADQSYSSPGLSVNFFAAITSKLPQVESNGDIISLQHVQVRSHNGEKFCSFMKSSSSFALFRGKIDMGFDAYQYSEGYQLSLEDNLHLSQLRTWLLDHKTEAGLDDKSLLIRSIVVGQVVDLICKVFHVCTDNGILFVWDGTDAPTLSYDTNLDIEGETSCPLYPEVPREVLLTFPDFGTVLKIYVGNLLQERSFFQNGGSWIRLCNVNCNRELGLWKCSLQPDYIVRLLSDNNTTVIRRERLYKDRIASVEDCLPFLNPALSSCITRTDYEDLIYSSLMYSLTYPEVKHKFKCVVRVISAHPWRGEDLRSPVGGHYRIKLTLEDSTARVHAYIFKKDAVYFFGDGLTFGELTQKMNKLLGIPNCNSGGKPTSRNPPWVCCCLKTYCVDESNPWGSRRYRLCGTKLLV